MTAATSDLVLVEEELRRRDSGPDDGPAFDPWLRTVSPTWRWDWPHIVHVREHLERVERGEIDRLMLALPPRHGKSQIATIRYPVWRLERDPAMMVVIGCYGQELASKFTRDARRLARQRLSLAPDVDRAYEWETTAGGGLKAVGVGTGITGRGADLLLIDDPVKSRAEAESATYRDRVWDWYANDLYTRLEPGGAIVLTMTRWHQDDLAGRILASREAKRWTVVHLPAIAEESDPIGRRLGEALCPDRYTVEDLERIRDAQSTEDEQGEYAFQALYQGRPSSREGDFFHASKIEAVSELPVGLRSARAWDMGATAGAGDYTCGVRMSGPDGDGRFYFADVVRGRWDVAERNATIQQTAGLDGRAVRIRGPQDPGAAGVESARMFTQLLSGYSVKVERVTGEKSVRAEPLAAQVNAGNVRMLKAPWNRALIEELRTFPRGQHDDQVDAAADAFATLKRGGDLVAL